MSSRYQEFFCVYCEQIINGKNELLRKRQVSKAFHQRNECPVYREIFDQADEVRMGNELYE
jgi:hypothetical protein